MKNTTLTESTQREAAIVQVHTKPQKAYDIGCRLALAVLLLVSPAFGLQHHARNSSKKGVSSHKVYQEKITLFPTAGSLLAQNQEVTRLGLSRVANRAMLAELAANGTLTPILPSSALKVSIAQERAYLRPWADEQLNSIAETFYAAWGKPLTVDSAIRPLDLQKRLWRSKRVPAAPPTGPLASVHPAGIAFDIGKKSLTKEQKRWLEWRLFYLQAIGWAIVEEERACFHVVIIEENYVESPERTTAVSQRRQDRQQTAFALQQR